MVSSRTPAREKPAAMVQEESVSVSTPQPARPPTPPRESSKTKGILRSTSPGAPRRSKSTRRTSAINPLEPPLESSDTSTGSARKRVEWADRSGLSEMLSSSADVLDTNKEPHQPVSSSVQREPPKSILRVRINDPLDPNHLLATSKLLPLHHHATFATMLESITQQLAGRDRSSKMDAYLMLSSSIKASENVPDLQALKSKMGLLLSFIQRDLAEKADTGKPDSSLVINALILLSSFLHKPEIAGLITLEFAVHIVDYSIRSFEDGASSKDVARHLLFILAQQAFPPKVMNQERVGRLITSLHNIESGNLKGKSIIASRANIYRTLLRHSRNHMITNQVWIEDLFTDMLSTLKDIRAAAINFGLECSSFLGSEAKVSRTVSNLFQLEVNEQDDYGSVYAKRLSDMIKSKQDSTTSPAVPQIWSVVLMFLRGRHNQVEQWRHFRRYLAVLEACLNCSDGGTRREALFAWNRLIFIAKLDEQTSPSLIELLHRPLSPQIQRGKQHIQTLSTACCLLYYSLRPTASHAQLDLYWNEYVVPLVGKTLVHRDAESSEAKHILGETEGCSILQALFDNTAPQTWDEARILINSQHTYSPKDLPALDSKWLRKSALRVFQVLDPLLGRLYWELAERQSGVHLLWKTYVASIASPSVMEVKVSPDTMASVASVFGFLHKIWHAGPAAIPAKSSHPSGMSNSTAFVKAFDSLTVTLLQALGPLPFTERQLCMGNQDTFIPVATPSQHVKKLRGQVKIPLHHLITLLSAISPGLEYDTSFLKLVHHILAPFFESRSTVHGKIELARSLSEILPYQLCSPPQLMWQVIAQFTIKAVDLRDAVRPDISAEQPLGAKYRDLVKILEVGVNLSPQEPLPGWNALFEASITSATIDAGDAGRAIAIIDPLAKACQLNPLHSRISPVGLFYFPRLLGKATYPKDRLALDAASKRLWGTVATIQKPSAFDPYIYLYSFVETSLKSSYTSLNSKSTDCQSLVAFSDILASTNGLLKRCPLPLLLTLLLTIQDGVELWISDIQLKTSGGNVLSRSVMTLWVTICDLVPKLQAQHGSRKTLLDVGNLLCSGFQSKHTTTINSTVRMWNSTFGVSEEELEYPPRLQNALSFLRSIVDIHLPSFPTSLETDGNVDQRQPTGFADSQQDVGHVLESTPRSTFNKLRMVQAPGSSSIRSLRQRTPQVAFRSSPIKRSRGETPEKATRNARRRATPKLRHDDSQIQFEAVDSSPINDRGVDLLTDRQTEVRNRQKADAAMFPDIRSSASPKDKYVDETDELDLPIHPSSSSKLWTNSRAERQTTPSILIPSDDNHFIPSSPTPTQTRSMKSAEPDDPPSSPPDNRIATDAAIILPPSHSRNSTNIELNQSSVHLTAYPSAQIDPDAFQHVVSSTYGTTIDLSGMLTTPDIHRDQRSMDLVPSNTVEVKADIEEQLLVLPEKDDPVLDGPSISSGQSDNLTPNTALLQIQLEDETDSPSVDRSHRLDDSFNFTFAAEVPSAQLEHSENEGEQRVAPDVSSSSLGPIALPLPLAVQSVVALTDPPTSPISSDNFEDAVSSPRLFTDDQQRTNRRISPRAQPQVLILQANTPLSQRKSLWHANSLLRRQQTTDHKEPQIADKTNPLSPISSLIPETPFGTMGKSQKIVLNGEEFDPEDTIWVDDSATKALPNVKTAPTRKLNAKSRKRKEREDADRSEIPDSQEAPVDEQTVYKKRRGRSKKSPTSSQPHEDVDGSVDLDIEVSRNASSVDLGASIADDSTSNAFTSSDKRVEVDMNEDEDIANTSTNSDKPAPAQTANEIDEEDHDDSAIDAQLFSESQSQIYDTINETVLGDDTPVVPADKPEVKQENDNEEDTELQHNEEPMETTEGHEDIVSPPPIEEQAITAGPQVAHTPILAIKLHLDAMMEKLKGASLSRDEANQLEDMFMDAKGLMYEARRRGRQSVDI